MRQRDLRLLELIGSGEADCGAAGRVAVRAILAERAELLRAHEVILKRVNEQPPLNGASILITRIKILLSRADGGPACGG
jgi:hypothetical protein